MKAFIVSAPITDSGDLPVQACFSDYDKLANRHSRRYGSCLISNDVPCMHPRRGGQDCQPVEEAQEQKLK